MMFRSVKRKIGVAKEKYDFKLEFHATQVPQSGWDKLLVRLIPLESGTVIGKTEKAMVRDGTCQWMTSICESAKLPYDEKTRDSGKAMYKLVVSKGSSRSKVLGETSINLAEYIGADSSTSLALPLEKCDWGTVLHVNVLYLAPKSDIRYLEDQVQQVKEEQIELGSEFPVNKHDNSQHSELGIQTSESKKEDAAGPAIVQCNLNSSEAPPTAREYSEADQCAADGDPVSSSTSRSSANRRDNSIDGTACLSGLSRTESQDLKNVFCSSVVPVEMPDSGINGTRQLPHSLNHSDDAVLTETEQDTSATVLELNLKENFSGNGILVNKENSLSRQSTSHREITSPITDSGNEKTHIEELQTEVSLYFSASNKNGEIEKLKRQLDLETKHAMGCESVLLALTAERDTLKLENEQFRSAKHTFEERIANLDKVLLELEDAKSTIKELKDEMHYEKSANLSLNLQLQKTQESNSELLLEIKDLEGILVERNKEIECLKLKLDTHAEDEKQHANILEDPKNILLQNLLAGRKEIHRLGEEISNLHASARNEVSIPDGELEKMILKFMEEFDALESVMQELTTEKNMDLVIQWMQNNAQANARSDETAHQFRVPLERFWLSSDTELDANQTKGFKGNNHGSVKSELSNGPIVDSLDSSSTLLSRIADLEMQLECSKQEVSSLAKKVDALKGEIENSEKERSLIASQRGQLKYLREKVALTEQEHKSAIKRAEDLEVANMDLKKGMDSVVASLQEQLRKTEEKACIAVQSCTDAHNKISDLQVEKYQLNEHISELIVAKQSSEAIIRDLEGLNARLQDSLQQAEFNYIEVLRQVNEREEKVAYYLEQLTASEACAKDLKDNIMQLEKNSKQLEIKIQGSEKEGKANRYCADDLNCKLSFHNDEMCSLTRTKSAAELKNEDLEAQNEDLRNKLHIAENKYGVARKSAEILVQKIKTLKSKIELSLQHSFIDEQIASNLSPNNDVTASTLHIFSYPESFDDLKAQLRLMQDMIEHAGAVFSCHVESLDKIDKVTKKKQLELEMRLEEAFKEMDRVMKEKTCCQERETKLEAEYAAKEEEKYKLGEELKKLQNEFEYLQIQLEGCRNNLQQTQQEKVEVEATLRTLRIDHSKLSAELTSFREKAVANEEAASQVKHVKNATDQKNDLARLRRRVGELKRKLVEQEEEKDELKKKVYFLGEEVRCKAGALAIAEKKLKEKQKDERIKTSHGMTSVSANARLLPRTKSNSGVVLNSSMSHELVDLQTRVKLLQDEVTAKSAELKSSKKVHEETERELCDKIEHLKSMNEQLIEAQKNCVEDNSQ